MMQGTSTIGERCRQFSQKTHTSMTASAPILVPNRRDATEATEAARSSSLSWLDIVADVGLRMRRRFPRLRREVRKLKAERDILKKAAAYFVSGFPIAAIARRTLTGFERSSKAARTGGIPALRGTTAGAARLVRRRATAGMGGERKSCRRQEFAPARCQRAPVARGQRIAADGEGGDPRRNFCRFAIELRCSGSSGLKRERCDAHFDQFNARNGGHSLVCSCAGRRTNRRTSARPRQGNGNSLRRGCFP